MYLREILYIYEDISLTWMDKNLKHIVSLIQAKFWYNMLFLFYTEILYFKSYIVHKALLYFIISVQGEIKVN